MGSGAATNLGIRRDARNNWGSLYCTYSDIRIKHTEPALSLLAVKPLSKSAHHPSRNLLAAVVRRCEHTRNTIGPFHAEPAVARLHGHRLLQRLDGGISFLLARTTVGGGWWRGENPVPDPAMARQVVATIDCLTDEVVVWREFSGPGDGVGAPAVEFLGRRCFAEDEGRGIESFGGG